MTAAAVMVLIFAADAVWTLLLVAVTRMGPEPSGPYVARHATAVTARRIPGATLDPVTLALPPIEASPLADADLRRVIAALSDNRLPVLADRPVGASGKRHDPGDFPFRSDGYTDTLESFFADQSDGQAVNKRWAGAGR